ncbi:putative transposase YbfD/YdcC [Spirosoma sp. LMG 31448]|uniref:Transposase YbfD/YdcC n=1 Tax=Spirosoma utsteinense TaxID=2585773 RepID=A0ABR6WF38_9BACT|nr:putative transposase YbfD/YdcC [Spirosoma utsteinense]MBC3795142.1 putative transposase YbfD/YdcC [Spirosoma utsteinense]
MTNQFESLLEATQLTDHKVISRAQLPILLAKINGSRFTELLFEWFGFVLEENQKRWFAVDGKELRGSIQTGHTRGEVCVSALAHQSRQVVAQTFYCGAKESERPAVSHLLEQGRLVGQKLTLDALHLIPLTLHSIHAAAGVYVVGLKANQTHLYRYCICRCLFNGSDYERVDAEAKHHGRVEQRTYCCFSLKPSALAPRWQDAGVATLVCVERCRQQAGVVSKELSYFVSNNRPTSSSEAEELFNAIRQHWAIEVMHHKRDVTLSEDDLQTGSRAVSRLMGSLRTLVINLLERLKVKNMAAQLDNFAGMFNEVCHFLRSWCNFEHGLQTKSPIAGVLSPSFAKASSSSLEYVVSLGKVI